MRKPAGRFIAILISVTLVAFGLTYRYHAIARAAEFLPLSTGSTVVPAGTPIHIVLSTTIIQSTAAGDPVRGFVSAPVMYGTTPLIPAGALVNGVVQSITKDHGQAVISVRFLNIAPANKIVPLDGVISTFVTPVASDFEVVEKSLDTIVGAGVGTALGAASQDSGAAVEGMARGTMQTLPVPDKHSAETVIVLSKPLGF